jgi:hypothetical protein
LRDAIKLPKDPQFNATKKTAFYVHGYLETMNYESIKTIVAAYQQRADHNIIILNWEKISAGDYFFNAFLNTMKVTFTIKLEIVVFNFLTIMCNLFV